MYGELYYKHAGALDFHNNTFVLSTIVNRTIQSGYAELTGFMQERMKLGGQPYLSRAQWDQFLKIDASSQNVTGMPPFTVRRAKKISDSLARFAICEGYFGIPIYTSINKHVWENQLQYESCNYAAKIDEARFPAESTYTNAAWLRDALREEYKVAFNLSDEKT